MPLRAPRVGCRSCVVGLLAIATGLLVFPAVSSAAVLYDQSDHAGSTSTFSMGYSAPNDTQVADDFTVPTGQTWTLSEVDVLGSGPTGLHVGVDILPNAGSLPGAPDLFSQDNIIPTNEPSYHVPLTGAPALGPGTYWISVAVEAVVDFWGWQNRTVQSGHPAAFQNPSGGFNGTNPSYSSGCTTWTQRTTCYAASAAEPDQAFQLLGTSASSATSAPTSPPTKCKKKKKHKRSAESAKKKKCKKKKK